jgi:hypothetical protein
MALTDRHNRQKRHNWHSLLPECCQNYPVGHIGLIVWISPISFLMASDDRNVLLECTITRAAPVTSADLPARGSVVKKKKHHYDGKSAQVIAATALPTLLATFVLPDDELFACVLCVRSVGGKDEIAIHILNGNPVVLQLSANH